MLGQIKLVDKTSLLILKCNQFTEGECKNISLWLCSIHKLKGRTKCTAAEIREQKQEQLEQNKIFLGFMDLSKICSDRTH